MFLALSRSPLLSYSYAAAASSSLGRPPARIDSVLLPGPQRHRWGICEEKVAADGICKVGVPSPARFALRPVPRRPASPASRLPARLVRFPRRPNAPSRSSFAVVDGGRRPLTASCFAGLRSPLSGHSRSSGRGPVVACWLLAAGLLRACTRSIRDREQSSQGCRHAATCNGLRFPGAEGDSGRSAPVAARWEDLRRAARGEPLRRGAGAPCSVPGAAPCGPRCWPPACALRLGCRRPTRGEGGPLRWAARAACSAVEAVLVGLLPGRRRARRRSRRARPTRDGGGPLAVPVVLAGVDWRSTPPAPASRVVSIVPASYPRRGGWRGTNSAPVLPALWLQRSGWGWPLLYGLPRCLLCFCSFLRLAQAGPGIVLVAVAPLALSPILDVIGVLVEISKPKVVHLSGKAAPTLTRDIILRDLSYFEIKVTLWGHRASAFMIDAVYNADEPKPIIVLLVSALAKTYQDQDYLSGNAACRWYFSPQVPEANPFYASLADQHIEIKHTLPAAAESRQPIAAQALPATLAELEEMDPYDIGVIIWNMLSQQGNSPSVHRIIVKIFPGCCIMDQVKKAFGNK
ncbi:hypothetical protein U9M48_035883 [Paspalum notatum var. saurae]|uniref:Replication protein A OB domain-containing protein n=1 Tax=Paspalum notatum var. saurae TaxID=547442 RepID=A0AAQ3UG38_PASNO